MKEGVPFPVSVGSTLFTVYCLLLNVHSSLFTNLDWEYDKTMSNVEDLQKSVVAFRDERDWKQFHNPKDSAISLTLEAAEVIEHFQWKSPEEIGEYVRDHREDIGEELADVLYWVLLMANDLELDLSEAFKKKMQKNATKYPVDKAKGNHKKYTELS